MNEAELIASIRAAKERLGGRLAIAAHHYQRPEIVALADFVGDSYKLAVEGARSEARYIAFCGVRFMAESAAVLARPGQLILSPDLAAGCPMADMVDAQAAEKALAMLDGILSARAGAGVVAPVTYMNSYADMKALTGRRSGSICTSSNAALIVKRYLDEGRPVFFSPDFNLGANTARQLGLDLSRVFKVRRDGSLTGPLEGSGDPARALMFIWDGHCAVHTRFKAADIAAARASMPGVTVVVHPECDPELVALADVSGSTEAILKAIAGAPAGSSIAVGTEANFVLRMAADYPDRVVKPLRTSFCANMARIDLEALARVLASIEAHERGEGPLLFPLSVDEGLKRDAAASLERMIAIVEGRP